MTRTVEEERYYEDIHVDIDGWSIALEDQALPSPVPRRAPELDRRCLALWWAVAARPD